MMDSSLVGDIFRLSVLAELVLVVVSGFLERPLIPLLLVPIAVAGSAQPREWSPADAVVAGGYAGTLLWRLIDVAALTLARHFPMFRRERPFRVLSAHRAEAALVAAFSLVWLTGTPVALFLGFVALVTWSANRRVPEFKPGRFREAAQSVPTLGFLATVGVGVGVSAGSYRWVDAGAATDVLPQLIAIQLALGLLPLTALLVVAQLATGAYGPRSYQVLPYGRTLGVLLCLVASVSIDLWLLGAATPQSVELAQLLAAAVTISAALMAGLVVRQLDWRRVATAFVTRLNLRWLESVIRALRNTYQPVDPSTADATADVERLLYLAATRDSDIRRFRQVLGLMDSRIAQVRASLRRRIDEQVARVAETSESAQTLRSSLSEVPGLAEVALDRHFARYFAALVGDLARERKAWALDGLVDFRRALGRLEQGGTSAALEETVTLGRGEHGGFPPGCQMYGAIANAALEAGLEEVATSAMYAMAGYVERSLASVPPATGVTDVDTTAKGYQHEVPGEVFKDGIEQYLSRLQHLAAVALKSRELESLRGIAFLIEGFQEACSEVGDAAWTSWLTSQAAWSAYRIAVDARDQNLLAYRVPGSFKVLDPSSPSHTAWLERTGYMIPVTVVTIASVANWMLVSDVASLARQLLQRFPEEAAGLAAALRVLDERVALLEDTPERRLVRREVSRRVDQLSAQSGAGRAQFEARVTRIAAWLSDEVGEQ